MCENKIIMSMFLTSFVPIDFIPWWNNLIVSKQAEIELYTKFIAACKWRTRNKSYLQHSFGLAWNSITVEGKL